MCLQIFRGLDNKLEQVSAARVRTAIAPVLLSSITRRELSKEKLKACAQCREHPLAKFQGLTPKYEVSGAFQSKQDQVS